jgi:hypothetical protein
MFLCSRPCLASLLAQAAPAAPPAAPTEPAPAAAAPAPAAPAAPDTDSDAEANRPKQLFDSGVQSFEEGRFADALASFEQAYRLKPHPLVQVNIANCYDKLNQPAEALEHFEAFLASSPGNSAQRDEVRTAVARLSKLAGRLNLQLTPEQAAGTLDDQAVLHPPNQWVTAGRHRLSFAASGYEPAVRVVDVRAGETVEVSVNLQPLPPPTLATSAAPAAAGPTAVGSSPPSSPAVGASGVSSASRPLPANVWISGGATFGLGVVAVVTGQLALAANREFDTNLGAVRNSTLTEYQRAGAWARGVDAANRADALAVVTDVLLAMTLVGAGLTTYFYLADRNQPETATPRVSLRASPRAGELALRGHF